MEVLHQRQPHAIDVEIECVVKYRNGEFEIGFTLGAFDKGGVLLMTKLGVPEAGSRPPISWWRGLLI